jgi:hypothetical protein
MTTIVKVLFVAMTLAAGTVAAVGPALTDVTYHWGYPDSLKDQPNIPVQPLGGESGIPLQYR